MQPEAISAFIASGAAVLGVPAALVVGIRQARAARQAAEMASQAAREQWRNSNRREAAVTFVVAAESVLEEVRRINIAQAVLDLSEAEQVRRALWRALAVVRIEGPQSLSDVAAIAQKTVNRISSTVLLDHRKRRPRLLLQAAADEGNETAKKALRKIRTSTWQTPFRDDPVWRELRESGLLPKVEVARLARLLDGIDPPEAMPSAFFDPYEQARDEIEAFIDAVRAHLDGPPSLV
ncbi:hypothetical protein ACH4UR_24730 [Streptomyces lydicus]|uniref:hypothetical protein n=1 Tax=Streptomyces lydicus TaxID=47763 RepID=UPI0033D4A117